MAIPLRQLAVRHLEQAQQPRAKQFRKVCDLYVLNDRDAKEFIAQAVRHNTFDKSYVLNRDIGSLTYLYLYRTPDGYYTANTYALTSTQMKKLQQNAHIKAHGDSKSGIPLGWDDIRNIRRTLKGVLLTTQPIISPEQVAFLEGESEQLILPLQKQLSETEHPGYYLPLEDWLEQEAKNGIAAAYHPYDLKSGAARPTEQVQSELEQHFETIKIQSTAAGLRLTSFDKIKKSHRVCAGLVLTNGSR